MISSIIINYNFIHDVHNLSFIQYFIQCFYVYTMLTNLHKNATFFKDCFLFML